MPYPTPIIEIAFDDGPYVVSPVWTDVTAYVRGFNTSRGVPDDWTLQADGSATVTLSNRDRRFDPFNTSGPYYGKLLPRRQIRIRATSGGTTYNVFRGFIAGWPPEWTDAGYDSTVTLSCFDALQLLGSSSLPPNWALPYIQSLSPRHYWPMDDPIPWYLSSNLLLRDLGSASSQLYFQAATGYPDSPIASGVTAGSIGSETNLNGAAIQSTSSTPNTSSNFTFMCWVKNTPNMYITAEFAGIQLLFNYIGFPGNPEYQKFRADVIRQDGTTRAALTNGIYDNSEPHHLAVTYNGSTTVLFIDGVQVAQTALSGTSAYTGGTVEKFNFGLASYQEVAVFNSVLTSTQIQDIVRFSEAAYQETSAARLTRIIGQTPYSTSLVSGPSAPASDVLAITPGAVTAASELQRISESEYAPMFVNRAGTLTLYNQNQIRSQSSSIVSQVTYGSGGVNIGPEVQLQYDGDSMRNIANIEVSGGGVYIQKATSSVTTYGEAEQYVSTQVQTLEDADAIADIVAGWGSIVYSKASPVSVVLSPDGSWSSTLALELFDRFTLAVAPKTGNVITTPMLLSRISHSATPERWVTTLEGSARWAAVFILNQSTLGGTDLLG